MTLSISSSTPQEMQNVPKFLYFHSLLDPSHPRPRAEGEDSQRLLHLRLRGEDQSVQPPSQWRPADHDGHTAISTFQ